MYHHKEDVILGIILVNMFGIILYYIARIFATSIIEI